MPNTQHQLPAVILYHPKDWEVLPHCIWGLTHNTPCRKIYVIGRTSEEKRVTNLHPSITYLDENNIAPGLSFHSNPHPRWGWYLQQILKLSIANTLPEPHYLVIDADTVFLRKTSFFEGAKPLYATGAEYHPPYFNFYENLFGPPNREYSFIAHHMLFTSAVVREMTSRFNANPWWEPILTCLQDNTLSFSEFETYGHYLKNNHPQTFKLRNLRWRNIPGKPSPLILRCLSLRYHFCSFHAYTRHVSNLDILLRLLKNTLHITQVATSR